MTPLLLIASFLLPLIVGLMFLAAKAALYTVPLIILFALGYHVKQEMDTAEEKRKERERQLQIQVEQHRAEARRQAEARRRAEEMRLRAEAQLRLAGTGSFLPPFAALQPTGWLANVIEVIGRASNAIAAVSNVSSDTHIENTSTEEHSLLGGDCVICCVRAADILVMPCKHLALCGACSGKMKIGSPGPEGKCPLCRGGIADKVKVFRS